MAGMQVDPSADATLGPRKVIGLVAHDNKKEDLAEWAVYNRRLLASHDSSRPARRAPKETLGIGVTKPRAARSAANRDGGAHRRCRDRPPTSSSGTRSSPSHTTLTSGAAPSRSVVWNIPVACNRATADFLISSPLMTSDYVRAMPDYRVRTSTDSSRRTAASRSVLLRWAGAAIRPSRGAQLDRDDPDCGAL